MINSFEWDGTESGLEGLLVWWGGQVEPIHSEGCAGPNTLDCCQPEWNPSHNYGLEGSSCAVAGKAHTNCLQIKFVDEVAGTSTKMDAGDKVFFEDDRFWLEKNG